MEEEEEEGKGVFVFLQHLFLSGTQLHPQQGVPLRESVHNHLLSGGRGQGSYRGMGDEPPLRLRGGSCQVRLYEASSLIFDGTVVHSRDALTEKYTDVDTVPSNASHHQTTYSSPRLQRLRTLLSDRPLGSSLR
uniref:Uncharacterized protein n=1 Tax=Knipowitschia caucasica TaxID=637954 RepID=A0AAV2JHP5_KNICA